MRALRDRYGALRARTCQYQLTTRVNGKLLINLELVYQSMIRVACTQMSKLYPATLGASVFEPSYGMARQWGLHRFRTFIPRLGSALHLTFEVTIERGSFFCLIKG